MFKLKVGDHHLKINLFMSAKAEKIEKVYAEPHIPFTLTHVTPFHATSC